MSTPQIVSRFMSTPTYFVAHNVSLEEVDGALQEHEVSALAVTDDDGELVGVISRIDLIHRALQVNETRGAQMLVLPDILAAEVMTRDPVRVAPDDTLPHAARVMTAHGIHRVFVADDGDLAGVIATREIMEGARVAGVDVPLSEWDHDRCK